MPRDSSFVINVAIYQLAKGWIPMEITMRLVSELIEYENNPRINADAVEPVAESIKQFGFKVPILLDENDVIIAGHTRLKAARKLGLKEVPCISCDDLSPEQVSAFRLIENKTSEFSAWDFEKLDQELAELTDIDIDFELFGFEEIDLPDFDAATLMVEADKEKAPKTITCPHCGEEIEI